MGNKLTKSSAILMTALTLGTSTISTAQTAFAETGVIKKAETEAKVDITDKVQSTATLKKGNDNVAGNFLFDVTVTGKPGKVNAGDYVDYKLVNLPIAQLNNRDVTTADGTVIGKLTVVDDQTGLAYFAQNNPKPNTDPAKQALDYKTQTYTSTVRLVFNDKAATLDNISYSFGNTSAGYSPLAAKDAYQLTSSVISGTKTLATATSNVTASTSFKVTDDSYSLDILNANKNTTGTNMAGRFNVIISVGDKPINAGEQIEVTLKDPAVKFDLAKLKVGTQWSTITSRGWYTNMNNINPQGVIINEQQSPTYEVVSIADDKIVFKVVNTIKPTAYAFTNIPVLVSPTVDRLNDTASSFGDIKGTVKNITRNISKDISNSTNLVGSNLTADGVKQLRSLTVKYVDGTGKDISPQDNSNHNVGFAYTTTAKTIKGYKLKTTPANAKGTLNANTTVTYIYEQEVVTTVAPTTTIKATTVPTTVTTKAPTTTVKPATPNNGGNTDPASGRNTTTTKAPVTTVATTKAPTTTAVPKKVTTYFKDPNGKDLVPPTEGNKPKVDIPGYTYTGTTTDPNGNVVHNYKPTPKKVTTYFKDPNGKDLVPPTEGDKPKVDIPGYTYTGTTTDPNGNVIHNYKPTPKDAVKPKKVTTYFKDDKGNEVKPPVEGDQPKLDIPGYEYTGTTTDPDGNIIHNYKLKKVKTYFKDDKGNEVKPPVEGDQPKLDIPGYEYVGTETDPDGNVIHKYRKADTKPLPKTGDASSLIGLVGTGLASVIGLVNFKRKK